MHHTGSTYRIHTEPGKHEKYAIFTKCHGLPGIVRDFSITCIQIREKSRTIYYLAHSWLFAKWLLHMLSVIVNFTALHSAMASIVILPVY